MVVISNYFNHHQKPLFDQLYAKTNQNSLFIEMEKMDEERIQLGWGCTLKPDYVAFYGKDEETKK